MEVYVLNTNFESVAVIDEFESLIWTDRYDEAGDFELFMAMNNDLLKYIRQDYYLWNPKSEHVQIRMITPRKPMEWHRASQRQRSPEMR